MSNNNEIDLEANERFKDTFREDKLQNKIEGWRNESISWQLIAQERQTIINNQQEIINDLKDMLKRREKNEKKAFDAGRMGMSIGSSVCWTDFEEYKNS